ncbi:MAG: tyrosine-type recombinase/integrase [Nitrososphaerota archaeon]
MDISSLDGCVRDYLSVNPRLVRSRQHYVLLRSLDFLCRELGVKSYSELLKCDVRQLIVALQRLVNACIEKGESRKTVALKLYLVRSFLDFYDVVISPKKVKIPRNAGRSRIDRIPSLAELQKLVMGTRSARMRVLLMTLALTGMRLSEALSLRREWIDFERGVIRLPPEATKMGVGREIPIPSELREELRRYFENHFPYPAGYVFNVNNNPEKKMCKDRFYDLYHSLLRRLGLDAKTPDGSAYQLHIHTFRKWYRTMLESAGVNRLLIDSWMGHNGNIQKIYYIPTPEMVRAEFEKADKALRLFGSLPPSPDIEQRLEALEQAVRDYEVILGNPTLLARLLRKEL